MAARKLTVMERFRLRVLFLEGIRPDDLAVEFGVDRSTVSRNTTCKGFRSGTSMRVDNVARLHGLWVAEAKGKGMDLSPRDIADLAIIIIAQRTATGLAGFAQNILENLGGLAADARSSISQGGHAPGSQHSAL